MTNTTNILRTTTRTVAATFAAAALSLSITCAAQAQVQTHVMGNIMQQPGAAEALNRMKAAQNKRVGIRIKGFSKATQRVLNGKSRTGKKLRAKGNATRQIRQNVKMRQMFNQRLANGQKGILKRPGAAKVNKHVKFNLKPLGKGKKYRAKHVKSKHVRLPGKVGKTFKNAKNMRNLRNGHKAANLAKTARTANTMRKASKAAKFAKVAAAGTGVGAVVAVGAGLAGVDPVEMAALKATNPAEYNRRMNALKKNPMKYMGNNIKNNTKKVAQNVGNATKKAGCGIGNVFKKKGKKKKC